MPMSLAFCSRAVQAGGRADRWTGEQAGGSDRQAVLASRQQVWEADRLAAGALHPRHQPASPRPAAFAPLPAPTPSQHRAHSAAASCPAVAASPAIQPKPPMPAERPQSPASQPPPSARPHHLPAGCVPGANNVDGVHCDREGLGSPLPGQLLLLPISGQRPCLAAGGGKEGPAAAAGASCPGAPQPGDRPHQH